MFIEVISPDTKLFSGEIKQATLQTYVGEITILPEHMPLVSIIKPGLLKLIPQDTDSYNNKTFVFNKEFLNISIGSGVAYTDGEHIKLVVESGELGTNRTEEELKTSLEKRKKILISAKENNDSEAIENAQIRVETIQSHLSLQK
jgi:F-type H+-transporting ATPase subunit epsilon